MSWRVARICVGLANRTWWFAPADTPKHIQYLRLNRTHYEWLTHNRLCYDFHHGVVGDRLFAFNHWGREIWCLEQDPALRVDDDFGVTEWRPLDMGALRAEKATLGNVGLKATDWSNQWTRTMSDRMVDWPTLVRKLESEKAQ